MRTSVELGRHWPPPRTSTRRPAGRHAELWRRTTRAGAILAGLLSFPLLAPATWAATPPSPFHLTATCETQAGHTLARFDFLVPPDHVIYADHVSFETPDGQRLEPTRMTSPVVALDKVTGHTKSVYNQAFTAELTLDSLPLDLLVRFQGCSNSACYFPERHWFKATMTGITPEADPRTLSPIALAAESARPPADWREAVADFRVVGRQTGYLRPANFLAFLTAAETGQGAAESPLARYQHLGLLATLLLIVLGGVGLNLTPCVLPLIPINLAIIGAGNQARSRRDGFVLGGIYGGGMAVVYGALGLVVVLTGSKFGALNSSPWFNLLIALVFLVLALGMFDKINVDLSRFRSGVGGEMGAGRSRAVVAFTFGAVAALLAGACVAPVVISVLLLSAQLYTQGSAAALLLPFLLGVGMALPWPFAGAGLTFLPKPGKWMTWIKYSFGVLILLFAAYYGHLAYNLLQARRQTTALAAAPASGHARSPAPNRSLAEALRQARSEGRPVFVDFAASWCKNCLAMDETVFNQAEVQQRLKQFVVVRYPAEEPNASPAREVLDRFGVMGLPTYVVLKPNN